MDIRETQSDRVLDSPLHNKQCVLAVFGRTIAHSSELSCLPKSMAVSERERETERETYNEQHQVIELLEDLASRLMDRADHCVSMVVSEVAQSHCEIQRCLGVES